MRCGTPLKNVAPWRLHLTAVLSLAALAFYPAALLLPLIKVERLGHAHEDNLLAGVATLWAEGELLVGTVIFLFSIVLPPLKLMTLYILARNAAQVHHHHRALLYHLVEFLGRWGMLDVMLVALLVAFVKLGDLVSINAGAGLGAFTLMVLLSLLASCAFAPHLMWDQNSELDQ